MDCDYDLERRRVVEHEFWDRAVVMIRKYLKTNSVSTKIMRRGIGVMTDQCTTEYLIELLSMDDSDFENELLDVWDQLIIDGTDGWDE